MNTIHKRVIAIATILVLSTITFTLTNSPSSPIQGFAIYEDTCSGSISAEGYWELDANIECASGNGIIIDASEVTLDCKGFSIIGGLDLDHVGITASSDLSNISLQNCFISNFYDPITINSGSNLRISNTSVVANNSCVNGNWTDLGGNSDCLIEIESVIPTLTVSNQILYSNESFSYQIIASSDSTLDYSIDNLDFVINHSSGLLTNATILNITNYTVTVTVTDLENETASQSIVVSVIGPIESDSQEESQEEEEFSDDNDDSSSGSSGSSTGEAKSANICGENQAWKCRPSGECINGEEKWTCEKQNIKCDDPIPPTKRPCLVEETEVEKCTPNWECVWSECTLGLRQTSECIDLAGCDLPNTIPTEETCDTSDTKVAITGDAISALDRLKALKNPIKVIKNNVITFVVIFLLVIGFVLNIVLSRKKKIKSRSNSDYFKPSKEDQKLWDWEEEH